MDCLDSPRCRFRGGDVFGSSVVFALKKPSESLGLVEMFGRTGRLLLPDYLMYSLSTPLRLG